jgi:thiamine-phosphate pyrophosphorylase
MPPGSSDGTTAAGAPPWRAPPELLALSPGDLAAEPQFGSFLAGCGRAAAAGLRGVLLREPELFDADFLALFRELRRAAPPGTWLGIHDRLHLALDCGADGVHLGFQSLTPRQACAQLAARTTAARPAVGYSAHEGDPPEASAGADYLLLGPVFRSASHPDPGAVDARPPLGVAGFARLAALGDRPTWALGGIGPRAAGDLRRAGAAGLAVRSGIFGQDDPAAATAQLLAAWDAAEVRP